MGPEKLFDLSALQQGGSIRFPLPRMGPLLREGFAIQLADGSVKAYLNVCPHRGQPVDLGDGRLFTGGGALECQAHGALFEPDSGACRSGPCFGRALTALEIEVREGAVWLAEERVDDPE